MIQSKSKNVTRNCAKWGHFRDVFKVRKLWHFKCRTSTSTEMNILISPFKIKSNLNEVHKYKDCIMTIKKNVHFLSTFCLGSILWCITSFKTCYLILMSSTYSSVYCTIFRGASESNHIHSGVMHWHIFLRAWSHTSLTRNTDKCRSLIIADHI